MVYTVEIIKFLTMFYRREHLHGLVQDCSISSALAMEILQSCTKPSLCGQDGIIGYHYMAAIVVKPFISWVQSQIHVELW